jgi:large subunit ribosomal protein L5
MADDKKKGAKSAKADKPAKAGASPKPAKAPAAAAKPPKAKPAARDEGAAVAAKAEGRPKAPVTKPRLSEHYREKVRPALMKKFDYASMMQAPKLQKIVLNMGVGDAIQDTKLLDAAANELGQIAGQKPAIRRAKKSIANFKLREGLAIGCMVTLRGARMWEFYDRLINVAVPRIRDFRGVNPRSFDGRGNYTIGLTEQIIFPEINLDKVGKIRGMDVTIVTSAKTDEEGRELLRLMNMPFRQK